MDIKDKIVDAVEQAYQKAEKYYNRTFERSGCTFNLKGACAGKCCYRSGYHFYRFNTTLAQENENEFLKQTCPHEVAHRITDIIYGNISSVRAHGKEWKHVMRNVMQIPAERCHSYDVRSVKKSAKFIYSCKCKDKEHPLTKIRHNRIMKKEQQYVCKSCKQLLKFSYEHKGE